MKYLLNIAVVLVVLVAMVQGQTSYQIEFPYNKTVQVVKDTLSSLYTTARSYNWINIPRATNIAVLASATGTDAGDADTVVVTYLLRNSTTGAIKASATLGNFAIATNPDDQEALIDIIPDTTFVGYDQIRFGLTNTKLTNITKAFTFKLFLVANARSGGNAGLDGYAPEFNKPVQVYYKTPFTASTANDTLKSWINIVGAEAITVFARATDSAVVNVYYRLRNKTVGKAASAGLSDPVTTSFVLGETATNVSTSDTSYRIFQIKPATLAGYEQIQFYVDYQANSTDGLDGTAAIFRLYAYFMRRE